MNEKEIIEQLKKLIWEFQKTPEYTLPTTNNDEINAIQRFIRFI